MTRMNNSSIMDVLDHARAMVESKNKQLSLRLGDAYREMRERTMETTGVDGFGGGIQKAKAKGTAIPFNDLEDQLLVESLGLNKVGLITVKARAAFHEIEIEDTHEKTRIDGPSFFFTWWPRYGRPPVPGDWIRLDASVLTAEEMMQDVEDHLSEGSEFEKAYAHQHV